MDPIANMLVQIRNAQAVGKSTVSIPFSVLKGEILRVMKEQHFIEDVAKRGRKNRRVADVTLSYDTEGQGKISGTQRTSKQSRRVYWGTRDIQNSRRGPQGMFILSTSRGVFSSSEARKMKLGGEVLCEIW